MLTAQATQADTSPVKTTAAQQHGQRVQQMLTDLDAAYHQAVHNHRATEAA